MIPGANSAGSAPVSAEAATPAGRAGGALSSDNRIRDAPWNRQQSAKSDRPTSRGPAPFPPQELVDSSRVLHDKPSPWVKQVQPTNNRRTRQDKDRTL
eukprot:4825374-Alexandrium_andersonii.AAC.1